jgi:lipopolysaccharide transport system ATP-binding protein
MNTAIRVEHLSKMYQLGVINNGTFFRDVQSLVARKTHKPDPHAKIGHEYIDGPEAFWALKDVQFDVLQGDRVGILGKNGAGKSTLLKLISRISAPTEGSIKIKGRVASLLEVGTGFHKELTGRENIFLNGAILGMKKRSIQRKLDEIVAFSDIERFIDTPVKRYSSGMYVRLAFSVAAHLDSEILIADEVLAVGDLSFQKKAIGKMEDVSTSQGRTVLFVSHNIGAVTALCNKGILLEQGRLVKTGQLEECVERYFSTTYDQSSEWEGSLGDEHLILERVRLRSADPGNHSVNVFQRGESFYLDIAYIIEQPNQNYVFSVEFYNQRGNLLCVNSASDYFDDEATKELTGEGHHVISLEIDASLFAPGTYMVKFDFAIHNVKRIINDDPVLSFSIVDAKGNRQDAPARQNIIYPDWKWEIL